MTPFERLYSTLAFYFSLRVFGCACFVLLQLHEYSKLEPRSRLCCFLGYEIEHKGYHCWDPISQRLCISRHVVFWEHTCHNPIFAPGIFSGDSMQNEAAQTEPGRPDGGPLHQKNLKTGSGAHFPEFGEV